ncbi:hypothetical protein SAMN04489722_102266 [Algibacter lectus]|uniref:hypothetical protein n=1 Tax=Algibacter lectus TaxID=221126 RepID=UPI0008F100B0|nr:hypothetical protein [Algibacter lectus]SFC35249.1 hypothetical protein SAMN04489722_102266 [Algibacter lectus]
MKKFLYKSILFFAVVTTIITSVLVFYGGYVDYFYNKFTTPKASSMIFGDSRSLQGIQPRIINAHFEGSDIELPMFNYSFTLGQIAYGKPYLNSIKKKLDTTTTNGLFIITVHPFTLSNRGDKEGTYFEKDMPPYNMEYVNSNPNYEYLIKNWNFFHFRGIFRQSSNTHKDGWMEEKNLPKDTRLLNQWKNGQISLYTRYSKTWTKSNTRLNDLNELANYLKNFGQVFLVRLPIDKELFEIENRYWPSFNEEILKITNKESINYLNFCKEENFFKTYDGIHIDKFSGVEFTKILSDSIQHHLPK